ncbi:unnamed protein product, partial [Discosporangium mesarthrocarpum]
MPSTSGGGGTKVDHIMDIAADREEGPRGDPIQDSVNSRQEKSLGEGGEGRRSVPRQQGNTADGAPGQSDYVTPYVKKGFLDLSAATEETGTKEESPVGIEGE